jgi:hypothetical protein
MGRPFGENMNGSCESAPRVITEKGTAAIREGQA